MAFEKGKSGNPSGRPKVRLADGRTLSELAREHTQEAVETLVEIMRDSMAPPAARVAAADKIIDRGWGRAPLTVALEDKREPLDLSGMTDEQLFAIETLRSLTPLDGGTAGSC